MGCSQSKAVAAPTAAPAANNNPPTNNAPAAEPVKPMRLKNANGSHHAHSDVSLSSLGDVQVNGTLELSDGRWESLYINLPPPVDPADVPSVIADLMARQINMLNPAEITFLQRRIRFLVKSLANQTMMGRFRSEPTESKTLVEKFHLLDEHILRKLWVDNAMVGSAVILLTHLSEKWWRRAATIAQEAAESTGLVVDVNKEKKGEIFLPPLPPAFISSIEETAPEGVTFHSVCFLIALALRGTRRQRLQLLFYLLVKPATLNSFLNSHPAGGIPTWLLEVDNDVVISLPSMTHYYYFGSAFLPCSFDSVSVADEKSLRVSSVMERVDNMLRRRADSNHSPDRRGSHQRRNGSENLDSLRHKRHNDVSDTSIGDSDQMALEYLQEEPDLSHFNFACESFVDGDWTMDDFLLWASHALDDDTLDTLMYRAFASEVLPTPFGEQSLVLQRWQQWQQSDIKLWALDDDSHDYLDYISQSVPYSFDDERRNDETPAISRVWGYIGGFDGRGGLGHGIMYCVDKRWWDAWEDYVGWNWEANIHLQRRTRIRPSAIPTECLLDHSSEAAVAGTLGSYEAMKVGLIKGEDYVLVPPGVWDVLYELYGGGPPLPRIVLPPPKMEKERTFSIDSKQMEDEDMIQVHPNVEVVPVNSRLLRVPEALVVATHPWVFDCHVCDAQQPYRRGDAGPFSIRIMATPDQRLSRLYAEIIVRLPIHNAKAMDKDGRGQARLWREIEPASPKDPSCRYGPWSLLCKNRKAILPVTNLALEFEDNYDELNSDWRAYADHATVESIGLVNGDRIMLEYAVQNKAGRFIWPREAAAKASRVRRLADEDLKFRRLLRGVDENDKAFSSPPELLGTTIDAMDVSGRWFQVDILEMQIVTEEEDAKGNEDGEEPEEKSRKADKPTASKQIRVNFTEWGGHEEWIDIDSDRLATAGRFTRGTTEDDETDAAPTNMKNGTEAKPKLDPPSKKAISDAADQNAGKICTLPGYGACGLANLGNTCYVNSAVQCISYMPLLRAYLLNAQYKATGDLNKDNPLGTGGKLLEEFAELLRVMWSGRSGERSPTRFRSHLGKARSQFSAADQQDAQEFLNYLLDVLHEDSNKIKNKPSVEALEDDWVKANSLARVGEEAWRRFLRRNRSIMADVAMGQVLNTVTCPVCMFSSRNFDPFNILSIPFPTVADVMFVCTVIRRGTVLNSPRVLNRPRKGEKKSRFERKKLRDARFLSDNVVVEQYAIAMSRLADIGDLKLRLQNICGISAKRLKLCKLEEVVINEDADDFSPVKTYMKVTAQPDRDGPCATVAKSGNSSDEGEATPSSPTKIIAFEMTLRPRLTSSSEDGLKVQVETEDSRASDDSSTTVDEEDDSTHNSSRVYTQEERRMVKEQLQLYGDVKECRLFDTDPLLLSKAISRSLWPASDREFKLGLRVDAIDHRDHWFPGSVVEIIEGVEGIASEHGGEEQSEHATKTKVLIHFDNFSSKWDESYTIDDFKRGQVRPLYSHATPRVKPTEFLVSHRYTDRSTKANVWFGQAFFLQCENEWSTARAGAHILAQASRFLHRPDFSSNGPVDVDEVNDSGIVHRMYDKVQAAISDLIDLLVECDRAYVRSSLGISEDGKDLKEDTYRNPEFDAGEISNELVKKAGALLQRLPFEVKVYKEDATPGSGKAGTSGDEWPFPFSLMRTIGNYMNVRHAVLLHWRDPHWRDPPVDKKHNTRALLNAPVMYIVPQVNVHKSTTELLHESKAHASKNNPGSGGMHLSVCLKEFCKTQKLDLSDSWRCPRCKDLREGKQHMDLWRLPDLLTFHIKRFNCSTRWREKITTKVNFPLTGLDMSEWCHPESPSTESNVYDLFGVMNHYGGMTGGHYVALCKATACGPEGSEEVAYNFPGAGTNMPSVVDETDRTGWRLGVTRKEKEINQNKVAAAAAAKYVSESSEPLWLQFDDELVEPIPPRNVVSEMAYVLFYRRRQLTSANIAKYSTLD